MLFLVSNPLLPLLYSCNRLRDMFMIFIYIFLCMCFSYDMNIKLCMQKKSFHKITRIVRLH